MRYINQLQEENKNLEKSSENTREEIQSIKRYLMSEKFRCGDSLDGYVSTQDILNRLENVEMALRGDFNE